MAKGGYYAYKFYAGSQQETVITSPPITIIGRLTLTQLRTLVPSNCVHKIDGWEIDTRSDMIKEHIRQRIRQLEREVKNEESKRSTKGA